MMSRPITSFKTAWTKVRQKAGVKGRWHDNRHTLVTELAESGAGDEVIMSIAGHVSRAMLPATRMFVSKRRGGLSMRLPPDSERRTRIVERKSNGTSKLRPVFTPDWCSDRIADRR